jgi:hypothetical protein
MTKLFAAIKASELIDLDTKSNSSLSDYFDFVINEHEPNQTIVMPKAWLNNSQYTGAITSILSKYNIAAIIDIGRIWPLATGLSFTLLSLNTKQPKHVIMAEFAKESTTREARRRSSEKSQVPDVEYTTEFSTFITAVENALLSGFNTKNDGDIFTISYKQLDLSRLDVAFYHPNNQLDQERYKKATFEVLSKLAVITSVPSVSNSEERKVIDWSQVGTSMTPVAMKSRASYQLAENDIVVMQNLNKAVVITKALSGCYAPPMSFVVKLSSKKVSPEYICLYIQSEIAKKYWLKMSVGSVFKRLKRSDMQELPILLPDSDTLNQSKLLYQQLSLPEAKIETINSLISGKKDNGRLQDSFLLEELEKLRISKRAMIERIIKDDLKELKVCIDKGLYKASMVICGSVLEAVILDWLSETEKHDYYQDEAELSLSKALMLLHQLGELDSDVLNAAHNIRRMRNLIHPKNYLQNQGKVTKRECMKLLEELKTVVNAYKPK